MVKIACVGDSITWGFTILRRHKDSYPAVLQHLLGSGFKVRNFGVNNACANFGGDLPYGRLRPFRRALLFKPDIVVIMLGTNDSKRFNFERGHFLSGYESIVDSFVSQENKPKVYLTTPPPVFSSFGLDAFTLNNDLLNSDIIPAIRATAADKGLGLIEINPVIQDKELTNDGVHPNKDGARLIAETVFNYLKQGENESHI